MGGVDTPDGCSKRIPYLGLDVSLDISSDNPHDIGAVFVAFCQKRSIEFGLFHIHLARLHQSTPDTDHAYIDTVGGSHVDDIVEMLPVAVAFCRINRREVKAFGHRQLAVGINGWHAIDGLHLHHIVAGLATTAEIEGGLVTVESLGQQPAGISQPKEGFAIGKLEETAVRGHLQPAIAPRFFYTGSGPRKLGME